MPPVLEVVSHPTGPWLVRAGTTIYAVPPRLGRALRPLAGKLPGRREIRDCLADVRREPPADANLPDLDSWVDDLMAALDPERDGNPAGVPARGMDRAIRFRIPLLGPGAVRALAGRLRVLAGYPGLSILALLGGLGYLAATGRAVAVFPRDPATLAAGLALLLLTAVWHELGHAAALARAGYPPGGIGAGLLFVIPVLFADVTAVNALTRPDRMRVDAGGVLFQGAAGGLLAALGAWRDWPAFTLAGSSVLLVMTWSLFPFIRSDGYWLLCDWLELESLDRPPDRPVGRRLRTFLVGFQLANAAFLLAVGAIFPLKVMGWAGRLTGRLGFPEGPGPGRWLATAAGIAAAGMLAVGVVRRIRALIRSARLTAGAR